MADFLTTLQSQFLLTDGATGSLLFELTGRLSEPQHVYESFNLDRPELLHNIHHAYLKAGARCLKTNTFGANRRQLAGDGLADNVAALNTAGVGVARAAIKEFRRQSGVDEPVFILASVGPTPDLAADAAAVADCYRDQLESLIAAGADALLLETFDSLAQLDELITLIQSLPAAPPIIAEMTAAADCAPAAFLERMAARGVPVAGVNCSSPWDATAFIDQASATAPVKSGRLQLVAMPNAGGFQRIGNRFMSSVNAEFMGKLARTFRDRGVRLIGGCCEVHPPHIQEMRNYLHSRDAGPTHVSVTANVARPPVDRSAKRANGPFSRKLIDGEFVTSIEVLPPRGTGPQALAAKLRLIEELLTHGLTDAIDVTDGSRGIPLMPPGDFIQLIRRHFGWTEPAAAALELIPHFTGRDLNVMGIQSRLIGLHAQGIHNVLFITGDPPKMSPTYPRSTAVFDLDSVAMIRLTHQCLNAGVDFGGNPFGAAEEHPPTHFTIGSGYEPEALDSVRELRRLEEKLANGADYIMTQPAFRHEPLAALDKFRARAAFLVGVMILKDLEHALRMTKVPGVVVPEQILDRLAAFPQVADQQQAGRDIAVEQIRWVKREGWAGLYLMSPSSARAVLEVIQAARA